MNKPIFSVVIPTYNSSKTITKTINSVLKQNYQNFEIILVDDGSTDNTVNKVELINDNRIRIFKIKRSGGPAKPRNYGIKKSKSNWICFLDSDDLWEYNKLKILFKSIKNNDFDILCHNEYIFKLNKIKIAKYGPIKKEFYKSLLIEGNSLSTSATMLSKKFLLKNNLKFNESYKFVSVEDYDLWMLFAKKNANFLFINNILSTYIIHDKGISQDHNKHLKSLKSLLKHHVFKIQNFENDKITLWKYFEKKIETLICLNNFKKNPFSLKSILSLIIIFIKYPMFSINFAIKKIF